MSCSFEFQGKNALITGSTRGIGRAIAEAFAAAGATVVINGRHPDSVQQAKEQLTNQFPNAKVFGAAGDVANADAVNQLADKVFKAIGNVDILVNNAGLTKDNLLLRMKAEDWDAVLNANLKSAYLLSKVFVRGMLRSNWGRLINITSVVGSTGNAGQANYAASKAGLVGFTKSIARECAPKGITANAIAPGYIKTAMTEALPDEAKKTLLQNLPNKRLGTPKDIAFAALFLASEEASYITGQTLHVNGGLNM